MIASDLAEDIDWISIFSLMHNMDNQFNDRQFRFMKALIIEKAIETHSKSVKWVDSYSLDHIYKDLKIETKVSTRGCLCTRKAHAQKKSPKTGFIKLNNMYTVREIGAMQPFDYLMIIDVRCAAIAPFKVVKKHATFIGDGFMLDIPHSDLDWIIPVGEISEADLFSSECDLTGEFNSFMNTYIERFRRKTTS